MLVPDLHLVLCTNTQHKGGHNTSVDTCSRQHVSTRARTASAGGCTLACVGAHDHAEHPNVYASVQSSASSLHWTCHSALLLSVHMRAWKLRRSSETCCAHRVLLVHRVDAIVVKEGVRQRVLIGRHLLTDPRCVCLITNSGATCVPHAGAHKARTHARNKKECEHTTTGQRMPIATIASAGMCGETHASIRIHNPGRDRFCTFFVAVSRLWHHERRYQILH